MPNVFVGIYSWGMFYIERAKNSYFIAYSPLGFCDPTLDNRKISFKVFYEMFLRFDFTKVLNFPICVDDTRMKKK